MKKLKVGVWVFEDYKPEVGGGFGYYTQIINAVSNYNFAAAEMVFISKKFSTDWDKWDKSYQIQTPNFQPVVLPLYCRIYHKIAKKIKIKTKTIDNIVLKNEHNEKLKQELSKVVDIIYYPIPGKTIENFPYIYTLWDIGHLSMYAFPEVAMNGVFESRKQHHDVVPQQALMVFCESETGKKQALHYLNLNKNRIKVVPLFPSTIVNTNVLAVKPALLITESFFIHYPAQYWSHKNHYNLLLAFKTVLAQLPSLKLILCGADKGNKDYIVTVIQELQLSNAVIDLGFVTIEELKWLYQNSQGLVMPTFLGPTNMPLLEAAEMGCSVACSNLDGHKEQLGDYGYYFDPLCPQEIANQICTMIENKQKGKYKIYESNFNITNALNQIDVAFSEIKNIRFCWGTNDKIY